MLVGTFLGQRMHVINDPHATTSELRGHLATFHLASTLKMLGEVSEQLEGERLNEIEGVVVQHEAVPYIARVAVEVASDDSDVVPTLSDLAKAFRIYNGLPEPDPHVDEESWALEHLVRLGHRQVGRGGDLLHALARTQLLYTRIWQGVHAAHGFDVCGAIEREIGLSLEQLMILGFAYGGRCKHGQLVPYDAQALEDFAPRLAIQAPENERFLEWISATYDEIRAQRSATLDSACEKYELSPFLTKPAIKPVRLPNEAAKNSLVVPVPRFLPVRVTDGIYHTLATAHQGEGKSNPFRKVFGHVFQAYVGELLRAGSGSARVLQERPYGPSRSLVDSPDWMIVDGDRMVVIEVKALGVALSAQVSGDMNALKADVEKRIAKGVQQLLRFADDVRSGAHPELADLAHITQFELMVVVHGDLAWGNFLLKDLIAKSTPRATEVHLCSIVELESLQERCWGASPFALLAKKRASAEHAYNFSDWLRSLKAPIVPHPLLTRAADELLVSWGTPRGIPNARS